mmetsp:Transcript_15665/g.25616  ORF Transcript_15665/g.25616 Transcript_15665/m.25616 type:complete len:306 (+) Transcript_15665:619-1536(+)|eukprot:CAMPEP_0203748370 /NCGR_PEP_ID=MMETSP0098-20131031/3276_1 /ASSEMBLY_ACC=CAM_ASM_000208 /TAXON_ID=96639 /ORGANISM=" , Strain NY0313808BC1" /LENGTH=305 /DNA_ID=CAMNT_0050637097 /DNA_START=1476 /DNA_END=2393 /DNA_ORIENTATION=-
MFVWSVVSGDESWEGNELDLSAGAVAAAGLEICFSGDYYVDTCAKSSGRSFVGGKPPFVMAASLVSPLQDELVGDQQPMFNHFFPGGLGLIVTKVSIVTLSARLRSVQKRIEEIEEEDEEAIMQIELADVLAPSRHRHELSIWGGFSRNLRVGVLRDLSIISLQRVYELFAIKYFVSEKMAKSLVKNGPRSAIRKNDRMMASSMFVYMSKVGTMAFKSQIMFWVALFSVNQAMDTWFTYRNAKRSQAVAFQRNETYMKRLVLNALRCTGGCVLAAVGAAVGSAIKPGLGTSLGMNIAPQFVYIFI